MVRFSSQIVQMNKDHCCGCSACAQECPNQCIIMKEDSEGFLYPVVDTNVCIGCLKCEKVCPCINQAEENEPLVTYATINFDSVIRCKSSSGGAFYYLANKIIKEGGVVFGVRFDDNWNVIHDMAIDVNGLHQFMGSKYVQSRINDCFKKCKEFLLKGIKVLFVGTPCQIAGLRGFLKKDYKNLITVDIICHGVPSPMVWQKYVKEVSRGRKISNIAFRDKEDGWYNYKITLNSLNGNIYSCCYRDDPYMQLFLSDYTLRPSCYNCSAKSGRSGSDITLGDFWGVDVLAPSMYDGKGTGLMLVSTVKGKTFLLDSCELKIKEVDFQNAISHNKAWKESSPLPSSRELFFRQIKSASVRSLYIRYIRPELLLKNILKKKAVKIFRSLLYGSF